MKSRKIGVIMDPIDTIHPQKDTTFALMLEAQKRKWDVFYITLEALFLDRNEVMSWATPLTLFDRERNYYDFLAPTPALMSLHEYDIVLLRKDPPFDKRFLYTTYLLDIAKRHGCFIVNDPESVRSANEKLFAAWFPQCCPETLVTSHLDLILRFLERHQKMIIKPLGHMGGHGVLLLTREDPNLYSSIELLTQQGTLPIMAQRFIPEISQGDKRVLMIDGEPYPHVLARLPKKGDIRGNLSAGASAVVQPLNQRDRWIANEVGPVLKQKGLYFAGLDIIGDYLTEINVTSPTCVRELESSLKVNICELIWNALEAKIPS